jgi:esterase/lipase superfamily enzyme
LYVDPNLPRHLFGWRSPRLGLEMPIVSYGDRGHPLLLLPTAQADYLENERFLLIKAIEPHILAGKCRVFSIDSINRHAWMNRNVPLAEAGRRQALYAAYIEEEVVPYIRRAVGREDARLAVSGASFGAFHAANQFFRRPDLFDTLIAMSGFYDLEPDYTKGYWDENIYFNNPITHIRGLTEGTTLDMLRSGSNVHILTGRGKYEAPHASQRLSRLLGEKGIPHNLDMWGFDVDHDWPWWRRMLDHYIAERLGWG